MAETLARHPNVVILNEVVLNQVLVQFVPSGDASKAAAFTAEVIARVQSEGTCWLSGTTWQGKVAMRISISNWSTTDEDVEQSAAAILRAVDLSATKFMN